MNFENGRNILAGVVIGVVISWLARDGLHSLAPIARPVIKRTMKLAILGYERGREMAAHLAETVSDLAAEVEAETKSVQTSSSYIITPDRQSE